MENDELVRLFIERGVISTEERVKELEKRGWVKVTPEGFNDVCKEFAEKMKEKYPEIEVPTWDDFKKSIAQQSKQNMLDMLLRASGQKS
ncbi:MULTISPECIES: hypothetical protein [Kingella]|jgi:hypothetical protein|uniref:Uncharacterized protein n=2 Tax=Kingella TaxID=32257 RepID=C4GFX6_9NEIS|nr:MULTISPECIES: hypothetical protein [Kingella]EEP69131.1 hypothetical protein GCWU000324_01043 [Kingella oralis ATCC 51147]MBK0397272.1 hypothetical protein [Kingella bonacorsii]QMT41759.1 hypothetical protein H3L93_06720 [Kingella oralis]